MKLVALPYFGGKSTLARGSGPWVNSLLPTRTDCLYAEPFAGMLGVLLGRPPSHVELVNDLNDRVVNWWRVIRDKPTEFLEVYEWTPNARREYEDAYDNLDNPAWSDVQRAVAFTTILERGLIHGDGGSRKAWGVSYNPSIGSIPRRRPEMVYALSDRLRHVQIENRCAVKVVTQLSSIEDAIVYLDPPYRSAGTSAYRHGDGVDHEALKAAVLSCRGMVAISGYEGDGWGELGWREESFESIRVTMHAGGNRTSPRREKLYMNYDPPQQKLL